MPDEFVILCTNKDYPPTYPSLPYTAIAVGNGFLCLFNLLNVIFGPVDKHALKV